MPRDLQHTISQEGVPVQSCISPPLSLLDILLLLIMFAMLLFASWFRSQSRIFWGDEIMGWLVLRQDTWAHLLRAWRGGIDSSGFFFYFFARPWLRLFGSTEFALHLFSAFGMATGLALTWLCARRFYRIEVVAAVAPALFLVNRTALWQLANGRTYGVVMTSVGLFCYAMVRTDPLRKNAEDRWTLALTIAASLLLVGSHILGVLYLAAFFTAFLLRDVWFRIFRPRLYLAAIAGLAILPISWKNIVATTALGKPSFWTLRPGFRQLPLGFSDFSHKTGLLILVTLTTFTMIIIAQRSKGIAEPLFIRRRGTLYSILGAFALMGFGIFIVSKVSTPIFVDRYMLPMLIGDIFLLCELISRIVEMMRVPTYVQVAGTVVAFALIVAMYRSDLYFEAEYPQRDYTASLLRKLPENEPVILTAQGTFVDLVFYRNTARRFETPIDWSVQLDPNYGPGGVSGTHELENWKAYGFYSDQIRSTAEILSDKQRFTVVSDTEHLLWTQRYVLDNPAYRATELPSYSTLRIWQVEKR